MLSFVSYACLKFLLEKEDKTGVFHCEDSRLTGTLTKDSLLRVTWIGNAQSQSWLRVYGNQFCYVRLSIRKMHGAGFISGPIFTSKSSTQLNVKYNSKDHTY